MFIITVTEVPQADHGPLFQEPGQVPPIKTDAQPIEHARIQVATLDVAALIALIYAKPKKTRSDAGKPRAVK